MMPHIITAIPYTPIHPFLSGLGLFGLILAILIWLIPIILIISLLEWIFSPTPKNDTYNHSLEVLKERYAKGEIEKQEFEEKKRTLS